MGFSTELKEEIVKGVVSGYKNYIEVRKEAFQTLVISGGYAYIKGNHIEDQVAKKTKNLIEGHTKQKAGPTWEYLKFYSGRINNKEGWYFIIKNEQYFNKDNVTFGKTALNDSGNSEKKYLRELIDQNKNVDFERLQDEIGRDHQLELFNFEKNRDINTSPSFDIITYDIDAESKQLIAIKIWVPNPHNNKAVLLEDLTPILEKVVKEEEDYLISDEELQVLQQINDKEEELVDAQYIFGFEVDDEGEDEESSD